MGTYTYVYRPTLEASDKIINPNNCIDNDPNSYTTIDSANINLGRNRNFIQSLPDKTIINSFNCYVSGYGQQTETAFGTKSIGTLHLYFCIYYAKVPHQDGPSEEPDTYPYKIIDVGKINTTTKTTLNQTFSGETLLNALKEQLKDETDLTPIEPDNLLKALQYNYELKSDTSFLNTSLWLYPRIDCSYTALTKKALFYLCDIKFEINYTIPEFTVQVQSSNSLYGSAKVNGNNLVTLENGNLITLTAIPNEGYTFVKWSDDNYNPNRSFKINSSKIYTAIFEEKNKIILRETITDKFQKISGFNNKLANLSEGHCFSGYDIDWKSHTFNISKNSQPQSFFNQEVGYGSCIYDHIDKIILSNFNFNFLKNKKNLLITKFSINFKAGSKEFGVTGSDDQAIFAFVNNFIDGDYQGFESSLTYNLLTQKYSILAPNWANNNGQFYDIEINEENTPELLVWFNENLDLLKNSYDTNNFGILICAFQTTIMVPTITFEYAYEKADSNIFLGNKRVEIYKGNLPISQLLCGNKLI